MPKPNFREWLILFYSCPSHPVSSRMKLWRKLANVGAVQLKGAVYILPATEEHEEFCQWLIGEVASLGGSGAFVRTAEVRTMTDDEIRGLFTEQADREYAGLEKNLEVLERRARSLQRGATSMAGKGLAAETAKLFRKFEDAAKRDFFGAPTGAALKKRIQALDAMLRETTTTADGEAAPITPRQTRDYRGRTWATRKRPFVDRMASAWLIRRFIDPKAGFLFIEERDVASLDAATVAFDVRGGEFTHVGDLCTFEVMVRSFGIRDKAVRKIAEIVHDLDLNDDTYHRAEARGIEEILAGIRKTAKSDSEALERGMAIFELLYASKSEKGKEQ